MKHKNKRYLHDGDQQDELELLQYTSGDIGGKSRYNYIIQNDYHYRQQKKKKGTYIIDHFAKDVADQKIVVENCGKTMLLRQIKNNYLPAGGLSKEQVRVQHQQLQVKRNEIVSKYKKRKLGIDEEIQYEQKEIEDVKERKRLMDA